MLSRQILKKDVLSRPFSVCTRVLEEKKKKFLLPDALVKKVNEQKIKDEQFRQSLLQKQPAQALEPKIKTESSTPLNVELLQYKPLRLPQTHGHQVAKLKFRGYTEPHLTRVSEFAARAAFYLGIPCDRPKKLKTERRLYTVIKSPFAQSKSKENFLRITYNQELVAYDANPEVVDLWLSYINKYALEDVKMLAEITAREPLDFSEKLESLTASDVKLPEAYKNTTDPVAAKVKELLESKHFKQHF